MEKIIQVINKMISEKSKIDKVIKTKNEIFFVYDNKYKWSMADNQDNGHLYLHFYAKSDLTIEQLSKTVDWTSIQFATYSTEIFKAKEDKESFWELYNIINDKILGVNDLFDEILK